MSGGSKKLEDKEPLKTREEAWAFLLAREREYPLEGRDAKDLLDFIYGEAE